MKAITLWQPWASLIACGAKRIETRSWKTDYRGPIAIHASARMNDVARQACQEIQIKEALMNTGFSWFGLTYDPDNTLPPGCVVAIAELVDCVRIEEFRPSYGRKVVTNGNHVDFFMIEYPIPPDGPELSFGDYTPGRYAWLLENVKPLENLPFAKGKQGLWEWEEK